MSDSSVPHWLAPLTLVKREADATCQAESPEEKVQHLSLLKNAYTKLQEQFQTVNQELGEKTAELAGVVQRLYAILKQMSDGLLFIHLDGTVFLFNEAAQRILKMKPEGVLLKKFWEAFSDDAFGFSMREALRFGMAHRLLYRNHLEISTSFSYEGPKQLHGMILIFRDVSEKQKWQQTAHHNDRLRELGAMTATVAHEIRNPLGGIRGYASLLFRDLEEFPHLQEMAASIIEGTKALENMVSTVLLYSKPVQVQLQTCDVGAFLKQLGKFIRVDPAFPKNVKLALHIPDLPLLAPIDSQALKGALLNLIFNAFQAMPLGGILTISLLKMENSCQIAVSDTGMGIEEEQLKSLFTPFFTTKQKGNGLGLVETQKIVKAHLGSIEVRSQPKKGTTFTITLPLKR